MTKRVKVADVIDDPALQAEVARLAYESDLRVLAICQRSGPVPKALWRRIVRYRRELGL